MTPEQMMPEQMTPGWTGPEGVLVLGAGGFVGGAIMRALAAAPGLRPVAGVRRPRGGPWGEERVCDAADAAALERALRGLPLAVCSVLGRPETMVAATRNLCDAARRAGVRRVVFISSMAVYGPAEGLVDEAAPLDGGGGAYEAAKVACERAVRAFVAAGGDAVILRPGIVHGPGGEQWIGRIGRLLRAGRLGDLGAAGDGFCNLIHKDDVGAAVAAALLEPKAAGEAFNLADPDPPTWNDFFLDLARAIGVPRLRRISRRRLRAEAGLLAPPLQVAKILSGRLGLRPGALPEPIPPSLLRLWRQRIRLDHRKADVLLGFERTPRSAALAASADWFLAQEGDAARRPAPGGRGRREIQT